MKINQHVIIPSKSLDFIDLEKILNTYCTKKQVDFVRLAYDFAAEAHAGQFRKSGEAYIQHPLATAHILSQIGIDPEIVVAALLHDVPEDTSVTLEEIEKILCRRKKDTVLLWRA